MLVLQPPLDGKLRVTQRFGAPLGRLNLGISGPHKGVDFVAKVGTPAYASLSGRVIYRGWDSKGSGNLLILRGVSHDVLYAHLDAFNVRLGATVRAGSIIGATGRTGRVTGPHLHFGLRPYNKKTGKAGVWIDPMPYFANKSTPVVPKSFKTSAYDRQYLCTLVK